MIRDVVAVRVRFVVAVKRSRILCPLLYKDPRQIIYICTHNNFLSSIHVINLCQLAFPVPVKNWMIFVICVNRVFLGFLGAQHVPGKAKRDLQMIN